MFHAFIFCCCCLVGVFADELKSVMEGESVTLQINVTEIQTDDEITWTFGTNGPLIAKINGATSEISIFDVLDERFRDRLKLDKKTGSLTITNIRTEHAGVYEVEISRSRSETTHRFTVTVYAATTVPVTSRNWSKRAELHGHCCDSVEAVLRLVVTALMGVAAAAAAVLLVNDVRSTRG